MSLRGKEVLVTGATGFIGGRLAQRLADEEGAFVTGTGRSVAQAASAAGKTIRWRQADLSDRQAMARAMTGIQVVFHCAAWMSRYGQPQQAEAINVRATEALVRWAAEARVGRFVLVSSIAAYGPPNQAVIREEEPVNTRQASPYGRTKALGEQRALAAATELGLELVIVRPGMVYGPGSRFWSLGLMRLVRRGLPVIFGDGSGHAQPVYVDNLIDALLLAATRPQAVSHAFNLVDQPLPWRELFGYYGAMCRRRPRRLPLGLARAGLALYRLISRRPEPPGELLSYYTSRVVYPPTKSEELLGYRPRVGLAEGMRRTEGWLRQQGHLPPA
jgi:nucleoside-diphosphate-sugar epimerase